MITFKCFIPLLHWPFDCQDFADMLCGIFTMSHWFDTLSSLMYLSVLSEVIKSGKTHQQQYSPCIWFPLCWEVWAFKKKIGNKCFRIEALDSDELTFSVKERSTISFGVTAITRYRMMHRPSPPSPLIPSLAFSLCFSLGKKNALQVQFFLIVSFHHQTPAY